MEDKEKKIDITDFDQGPKEIIKYMDYLPDDDAKRLELLFAFVNKALGI